MKKDIIKTVEDSIRRVDMAKERERILVAVSGGPDSVFLLYALYSLRGKLNIELAVANLDHGLRGKASQLDSRFVKYLAEGFEIPFIHKKLNKSVYKDKKLSKEEIARKYRYEFLIKSAKKLNMHAIATGHTLDDHVETIMMRIIKGTTLRGVMGIPRTREESSIRIIRPLLDLTKTDIEDYLKLHSIPYRTDHTNMGDAYFRNTVRNRILPYLSQYNPRIKYALMNLSENLREDFDFLEEERAKRKMSFHSKGDRLALKMKDIIVQPKTLQREVIKDALSKSGSNIKKLSYKHWKDVDEFIRLCQRGKSIDLPGGVRIKKDQDSLIFFKRR